jgi:hypothetical protein
MQQAIRVGLSQHQRPPIAVRKHVNMTLTSVERTTVTLRASMASVSERSWNDRSGMFLTTTAKATSTISNQNFGRGIGIKRLLDLESSSGLPIMKNEGSRRYNGTEQQHP